jgi:putative membrane protein
MPYNIDWSVPQRQSKSAIFIAVVNAIKDLLKFAWPIVLIYLFRGKSSSVDYKEIIFLSLPILAIANATISFLLFRFHITEENLHIRSGFLFKKNISLPLEKIQAVHIDQHWMHQLFNVVKVSFDSSGSEKMEVKIIAIDRYRGEALREYILGVAPETITKEGVVTQPEDNTIIRLNNNDLWKLSISANHIRALLILLAFLFSTYQNFMQMGGDEARGAWKWLKTFAGSHVVNTAIILFIAAMVLALLVSTVRVVLKYYQFRISRSGKGYHIRSGLIELKEKLVPFNKVQYISWNANWLRKQMNLYLLQFHTTGANKDVADKQEIKVPITQTTFIEELSRFYHPLMPREEFTTIRINPLYIFRKTLLVGVLPAFAISGVGYWLWNEYAFLALLLIPLTLFQCWLFQKKFSLHANEEALQLTKGVYGITGIILQWHKIQKVCLQQSIYEESKNLATVKLHTAGGIITIPYILKKDALRICNFALYKVESANKPWL